MNRILVLTARLCAGIVILGGVTTTHADVAAVIGPSQLLNTNAAIDSGDDREPELATDGAGNWVAVWHSLDSLGGTIQTDFDILVSRSTDDGATWSTPMPLYADAATDLRNDEQPAIATDGAGTWVVAWHYNQGGSAFDIIVSRSTDNGATWSFPQAFDRFGHDFLDDIVTDGSGTWIIVWGGSDLIDGQFDGDVIYARSTDDALSWEAPEVLNTNGEPPSVTDGPTGLATDGSGHWIATWTSGVVGFPDPESDILLAHSFNNGATWATPEVLNTNATTDSGHDQYPRIATDGSGAWIAIWQSDESLGGTIGTDIDILASRSSDNGFTWSAPQPVNSNAAVDSMDERFPRVYAGGSGAWIAVWDSMSDYDGLGSDWDCLVACSTDDGATWSTAVPLNANAATDSGIDVDPMLAAAGPGRWRAAWFGTDPLDGSGADADIFTATVDLPIDVAQSFNIDFGAGASIPAPSYGGAANQPGTWQQVNAFVAGVAVPLRDISGALTPITLTAAIDDSPFSFDNPATNADDEALLDDAINLGGAGSSNTLTIAGLPDGAYTVYVYAWAPDNGTYITSVDVVDGVEGVQLIGGAWPGALAHGVTHSVHTVQITSGMLVVNVESVENFGTLNGLQIVPAHAFNIDFGTAFGTPPPEFGAAASQPGHWHEIPSVDSADPAPLRVLGGGLSSVMLSTSNSGPAFSFNNAGTMLDFEALLDDALDLGTGTTMLMLSGLANGEYEVHTYAWAPDNATYQTTIDVPGGTPGAQTIGGSWPGGFVQGTTHAVHAVTVVDHTLPLVVTTASGFSTLNGLQVTPLAAGGEDCVAAASCCDIDSNGIRDDGCVWCACEDGACQETLLGQFADMGGPFGACPPDQFANIHDRNQALACFAGTSTCDPINIDAGGAFGACPPDGFCNIHDANHALAAFAGTTTCSCPAGPLPDVDPEVWGTATLRLEARAADLRAGEELAVDVYLEGAVDALRSYQLDIAVSGGKSGGPRLVDIVIEDRRDAIFAEEGRSFEAFNVMTSQMLSGLDSDHGVAVEGRAYLATYVYQIPQGTGGPFVIDARVDADGQTFLVAPDNGQIEIKGTMPAVVALQGGRSNQR